ncbi:alpha/beta hydrolase [archaeon]|jgi:non-heme chloroperoxidase|nr:alpha/beta hydrolase [archaeon]MBT3730944.1 alpha/beta hydrolase [archaeon]MBT4669817.1 alpha/beta hydrolase [archaeon]MBT5029968.1 alpha/beta hydrolase [archaeon]MBT5288250.1 alpha/beta hydrolase [archaeon]
MKRKIKTKDGLTLLYNYHTPKEKKKPTLLYLHGLGGNWSEWEDCLNLARKEGYGSLVLDMRGHGLSSVPEDSTYYKLENFAKDIREIVKKEKINNYVLVGHSFGGSVMVVYCSLFKNILPKALVFVESTYKYPYKKYREMNRSPLLCYPLRKLVDWGLLNNKNYPRPHEMQLKFFPKENILFQIFDEFYHTSIKTIFYCLDGAREFSEFNHDEILSSLKSVKTPTLIIGGAKDLIIDIKWSEDLHKLIPQSKLKIFANAGHQLPLENPRDLSLEIFSFLKTSLKI